MTQVVWVDSRMRTSGTDSDFEVSLRETVHITDARIRIDSLTFTDSFYTTDAGSHLYFAAPNNSFTVVSVPQGAYTGHTLAAAIQQATGRDCHYDVQTNSITHQLESEHSVWLSDACVAARAGPYPPNASSSNVLSLNDVLGDGVKTGSTVHWSFVRMAPFQCLYLRSSRLRCEHHHGPRGTHDIVCSVPLTQGIGSQVEAHSPDGVYYNLAGGSSCRTMDFRLTDWRGQTVNLRGRPLSFQVIFEGFFCVFRNNSART